MPITTPIESPQLSATESAAVISKSSGGEDALHTFPEAFGPSENSYSTLSGTLSEAVPVETASRRTQLSEDDIPATISSTVGGDNPNPAQSTFLDAPETATEQPPSLSGGASTGVAASGVAQSSVTDAFVDPEQSLTSIVVDGTTLQYTKEIVESLASITAPTTITSQM